MCASPRVATTLMARAAALSLAAAAASTSATIVTLGDVNPNPASGIVPGGLSIGSTQTGSVTVNGGSSLTADQIYIASPNAAGNGSLTVTGPGTSATATWSSRQGNLDIGGAGTGSLTVQDHASFSYAAGTGNVPCGNFCWAFVGGAAGSTGSLVVSDGATFATPRPVIVGQGTLFTQAADGFAWGTPGGTTNGSVRVQSGAQATFGSLTLASQGGGSTRTGAEQSFAEGVVQGAGSVLSLVRQAYMTGDQALLVVGAGGHGSGSLDVKSGGKLTLDGSSSPSTFAGISLGVGDGSSPGTLRVDGAGSRVEILGGLGFINIGSSANSTGKLQITGGGLVTGVGDSGLVSVSVGRRGATSADLTVSGTDAAGVASTLRMDGVNTVNGAGPFINIGRRENNLASQGSVSVLGGGRIEIDTSTKVLTLGNGQPGMYVGFGDGSTGSFTVSGKSALTGAASTLSLTSGSGTTNYVAVGRDGAQGTFTVSGGGKVLLDSQHLSTSVGNTYNNGDAVFFEIGRQFGPTSGSSIGTATVSGAGSELALTGLSDRFVTLGRGNNAVGSLNINAGGKVSALGLLMSEGASSSATLNMSGGILELSGTYNGGPPAGTGGGVSIGRAGGLAIANIGNGSQVSVSSAAPRAGMSLGGTGTGIGGVGTMNVSGGSTVSVAGPQAYVRVGSQGSDTVAGIGTLNVTGAGSAVSVSGTGARMVLGATSHTSGTVMLGAGASITASSLVGLAHDGSVNTGGSALMVVNGTLAAPSVVIGSAGILGGSGLVVGNVVNHGILAPGQSPGRLTIDGAFDGADGKIVLEVEQQPDGSFLFDELVFGSPSQVLFGNALIEFSFLGDTDPAAFQSAGLFDLKTFFKEVDTTTGAVQPIDDVLDWGDVRFSARSDTYVFTAFTFSPDRGATLDVSRVPLPASWPLVAVALLALWGVRRKPLRV